MKLYYTRHGQTGWNAANRVCSVSDIPLNEIGIAQAEALAEKVALLGEIDVIVASPLQRARKTAEIVAEAIGKPVAFDERLREWDYGGFDGCDREVIAAELLKAKGEFAMPLGETGETLLRVACRVYAALEDIRLEHAGKTVLIVAHGALGRVIETYFRGITAEEFSRCFLDHCELRCGEL